MSGSTLNTDELDALLLVSGILHANPETRSLSHTLLDIVKRQRALGWAPTVSAQQVAERVGDPALAKKFAQQANEQRAGKVVAGSARPLYGRLADDVEQRPNEDDERRSTMLPSSFAFRVPGGHPHHVFFAQRVPVGTGGSDGYVVQWITGESRTYTSPWVAMQLRLDRWRPTHDPSL